MFTFAIVIGIYSYLIFFLGIFGFLYSQYIFWVSLLYIVIAVLVLRRKSFFSRNGFKIHSETFWKRLHPKGTSYLIAAKTTSGRENKVFFVLLFILLLQILVNLIGALGPELAFDALWYHLTLPKIFLLHHKLFYIPGELFNYSVMPKLAEMIYLAVLSFGNEIVVKLTQFSFGLLTCLALYTLSRKFFTPILSLLAVVIFYSNLVVAWESTTAYIDLVRAFFEIVSISAYMNWIETKNKKWFVISAMLLGFSITTKILAFGSLGILILLIITDNLKQGEKISIHIRQIVIYALISLSIPLPWLLFSYLTTGNPFYPLFTKAFHASSLHISVNPILCFQSLWNLFTHAADPLSPMYIAFLPLIVISFAWSVLNPLNEREEKKQNWKLTLMYVYAGLSLLIWYITPNTGGGRFIVPYLPVYSLLVVTIFVYKWPLWFKRSLFIIVIITAVISIGYRGVANKRYLPVIFGREKKREFLTQNLNFNFGDFYDIDTYFATHITSTDKVLLYGFHNEYYVDFPFVDSSYINKGERFNYIAIQHGTIPPRFVHWQRIYHNNKTGVDLYTQKNKQWQLY